MKPDRIVQQLAANIEADPARAAEADRHHSALLAAMNASHDVHGEQDSLCVLEAVARLLAQMIGALPAREAAGHAAYVTARALTLAEEARRLGTAATVLVEDDAGGIAQTFHGRRPQ